MKKSLLYTGFLFLGLGLGTVSVLAQTAPTATVSTTGSASKKTVTITSRKVGSVDAQAVKASVARQEPAGTQQAPAGTETQTVPAAGSATTNQSRTPQKAPVSAKPIVKPTQEKVLPKSRVAQ